MILSLLLSTFLTVFIAELGDKTQLATLTISGTSNKPLAVFLGSASALVLASLLGALTGGSISTFLPEVVLKSLASLTFLIIGIRLFRKSFITSRNEKWYWPKIHYFTNSEVVFLSFLSFSGLLITRKYPVTVR